MHVRLYRSARIEELPAVRRELRRLLQQVGAPEEAIFAVLVACSEACSNAICHPLQPNPAAFELEAQADPDEVRIIVRDFGNWRQKPSGDPGGMGLLLMRSLMDSVRLQRFRNGSTVCMQRRLSA